MNRVLTIYSAEKGIGKSILGINLGASLIQETQKSVILLEFHAADGGVPAWSLLKLPFSEPVRTPTFGTDTLKQSIQVHSSQLAVLILDPGIFENAGSSEELLHSILQSLLDDFDYVIIELSSHAGTLTFEILDKTDVVILMASSFDYEQPIGSIGHYNFRLVVNCCDKPEAAMPSPQIRHYLLPEDAVAVGSFRQSSIPFVIQAPHRPISQTIGRLARDVGGKQFGITLSGGAALSLTQLGILEVFDRNRITIDMIAGASFGALIGASLATGMEFRKVKDAIVTWAESCRVMSSWSWRRLLSSKFFLDSGLPDLCRNLLENVYFDDLKLPLNVVAVDTRTATSVVFKEGRVLDAVQSCMRIPKVFVPFPQTEAHLIDGSVIYPMSVLPLKRMGANICAAVAVTPTPAESQQYFQHKLTGRLNAEQRAVRENYGLVTATFDSLMERVADSSEAMAPEERITPDVLIVPQCKGISWKDFHQVHTLIDIGIQAAEEMISNIEKLKWG
ncbi:MAG: hypothetical protein GY801_37305 [bacterium]|nr:hypothetical protein [bacterium]